jgi:anti-anti-sigma regulatory factor
MDGLLQSLRRDAEFERPCFVLDFSRVKVLGERGIFLLLACLEEAMKSNGDVRLAGLQPHLQKHISEAGISDFFEVFSTVEKAAQSFHKKANSTTMMTYSDEFIEADIRTVA